MFRFLKCSKDEKFFRLKINYEESKGQYLGGEVDFSYGYDYCVRHIKFKRFVCYAIEFNCTDKDLYFSLMSDYLHDIIYMFGYISDNGFWSFSQEKCCYYHNIAICTIDSNCILNVGKGKGVLLWNCTRNFSRESFNYIDEHIVSFVNDLGLCNKLSPLMV